MEIDQEIKSRNVPIPGFNTEPGLFASGWKKIQMLALRPTHSIRLQISRALIASAAAAFVDCFLLALLVERAGFEPDHAAVISYLLGGVVNYALCSLWIFPNAPRNASIGFTMFTVLSLGGLGITWACMYVLNNLFAFHYALAKVVALALAFSWNFASRKLLLFR